jgi:hypothetical protein
MPASQPNTNFRGQFALICAGEALAVGFMLTSRLLQGRFGSPIVRLGLGAILAPPTAWIVNAVADAVSVPQGTAAALSIALLVDGICMTYFPHFYAPTPQAQFQVAAAILFGGGAYSVYAGLTAAS